MSFPVSLTIPSAVAFKTLQRGRSHKHLGHLRQWEFPYVVSTPGTGEIERQSIRNRERDAQVLIVYTVRRSMSDRVLMADVSATPQTSNGTDRLVKIRDRIMAAQDDY